MQTLLTKSLLPTDKAAIAPYVCLPAPTVCLSLSLQKTGILAAHCYIIPAASRVTMSLLAQSKYNLENIELRGVCVSERGCVREPIC